MFINCYRAFLFTGPHRSPSQDETRGAGAAGWDAGMAQSVLVQLAQTAAWFGALGVGTAVLNLVALRVVCYDEVPGWVQARIRWWHAHNPAFLVGSAAVLAAGLLALTAAAISR